MPQKFSNAGVNNKYTHIHKHLRLVQNNLHIQQNITKALFGSKCSPAYTIKPSNISNFSNFFISTQIRDHAYAYTICELCVNTLRTFAFPLRQCTVSTAEAQFALTPKIAAFCEVKYCMKCT